MAKVVFTDKARKLSKDEFAVTFPTFTAEAKAALPKASGKKVTSINHLRHMVLNVAEKYDTDAYNAYTKIPLSQYEGLAFNDEVDLSKIMLRMFTKHYPLLIENAIAAQIQKAPKTTKTIYFDGPEKYANVFASNGVTVVDSQDKEE